MVSTAPPTLKTALKNLRLINWGTQRNSNFSKLITTIFSHFTDIEWESLIPKVRNVTGTLEHRWDDVGTDHKVTPGVIYTPSTHFTVNTNHYKPEQLFDPPSSRECQLSNIFSKISAHNTFRCFYEEKVPGTMHWHIKCTDCIMSVNDDPLDLEESDELNEILSKVSGSKFNIMSFKFPVYDLTNPISFR